jgi:hypothetical protein
MLYDADKQGKYAMLTIDMKGKTVPDKNRAQQGHVMGLKGMSLQGGLLNFVQNAVMQQHHVDLVYSQSSNQSLEEAMTGLSVQLDFIRALYPNLVSIWIVSDKCSKFNSFEQIPFIVAGNERAWALSDISSPFTSIPEARSRRENQKLHVGKWLFTEAQDGRDQLDCHFAWITASFKAHNDTEGNKVNVPEDMFLALRSISTDIMNTHVLYGNTTHPTLKKKFTIKNSRFIRCMNILTRLYREAKGSGLNWPTTAEFAHQTSRRRRLSRRLMTDT